MTTKKIIEFIFTPTYFWADYRKQAIRSKGQQAIGSLIRAYNTRYLLTAIILSIGLGTTYQWNDYSDSSTLYIVIMGAIIWYLLSRANEVFYAFLRDAIEKVNGDSSHSDLLFGERIKLALKSYFELILDFALIYYLLPADWFNTPFCSLWDAIYFSGVTITTLGYGDFSPVHTITKLLTIYEVLCGFILIIVSFAVYTGRGLGKSETK